MNRIYNFLKPHSYFLSILGIFVIGIIFRTYNFTQRIGLGGDSGRDAMIAQVALSRGEWPLFASFSSAGPFVFGPLFYWFNMLAFIITPYTFYAPWILVCMTGILTVLTMTYIGYLVGGKKLSIVLGLFTAFCPQFIARSTFLSQHGMVGVASALLLLFFVLYFKKRNLIFTLLMGLSLGTAISMHYQAVNLVLFFPALLFVPKTNIRQKILSIALMFIGFLIPALPNLYWDSKQNFANIRNLMDYILIGQNRIYVANSWKIYLFQSLPDYWSNVVGGNKPIAFIVMGISGITFIVSLFKKTLPRQVMIIGFIFGVLMVIIRYYKGEHFEGYLIYTAPLILLLSAWGITRFTEILVKSRIKSKIILITVVIAILIFDFKNASQFIFMKTGQLKDIQNSISVLKKKYPHQKFAVYDYLWKTSSETYSLVLVLKSMNLEDRNGTPIGVIQTDICVDPKYVVGEIASHKIVDLEKYNHYEKNPIWIPVGPDRVYDDLITRWTKDQKLKTTFSLTDFIKDKVLKH